MFFRCFCFVVPLAGFWFSADGARLGHNARYSFGGSVVEKGATVVD
jgi:hypothetical protein